MGRLIILSGPSCVGKGPLVAALKRFYGDLASRMMPVVLYNSRAPRPGETDGVDYHFRSRGEIEKHSDDERFIVMDVRGDLQALDTCELEAMLAREGDMFFEGNPFIGRVLLERPLPRGASRRSAFLSPLSADEVTLLNTPGKGEGFADALAVIMRQKLMRRIERWKDALAQDDLDDIDRRARSACDELKEAWRFDWVIPNHDGEGHENWDGPDFPRGGAGRALSAFVDILEGRVPTGAETWDKTTLP